MFERLTEQVMVRLSPETRNKIREIAQIEGASRNIKVTESEIYRQAIEVFLAQNYTASKAAIEEVKA